MSELFSMCLVGDCTSYKLPELLDPFQHFRTIISMADVFLFNLEGVVISRPYLPLANRLPPNRLMKPLVRSIYGIRECVYSLPTFAKFLKICKFNVANIANNHIFDWGRIGIIETRKHLIENDIPSVGAGLDRPDACRPVIVGINDQKIGFLGYNAYGKVRLLNIEVFSAGFSPVRTIAGYGPEGAASYKKCRMEKQIKDLAKKVDFVIVSLHIGRYFKAEVHSEQRDLVKKVLNAGAHLVVCHSSHVPQGIMTAHANRLVFFGMGDFVYKHNHLVRESLIVRVSFYEDRLETIIHPVKLVGGLPHPPSEKEAIDILMKIHSLSKPVKSFKINNGLGFLSTKSKH